MANRVQAPPDLLLAGASTEHWRTATEIHRESSVSTEVIGARALNSKLAALVRRGELEKRPAERKAARGAKEYRRREASWWQVIAYLEIKAPTQDAAIGRISDHIDGREIPGLFPVANFSASPVKSPIERYAARNKEAPAA